MAWNGAEGRKVLFSSTRTAGNAPLKLVVGGSHGTKGLLKGLLSVQVGQRALIT